MRLFAEKNIHYFIKNKKESIMVGYWTPTVTSSDGSISRSMLHLDL